MILHGIFNKNLKFQEVTSLKTKLLRFETYFQRDQFPEWDQFWLDLVDQNNAQTICIKESSYSNR